jgi:predicted kinase
MANLYIIRGVPGSGKTTLAYKMIKHGMVDAHFEADMFMVNAIGDYEFNPKYLKFSHEQCQRLTDASLKIGRNTVVSNTFTRMWEMQHYIDMAKSGGHKVTIIVCQGEFKNIHGVPDSKVKVMRDRFEY